jgi:hypothetical protein
MATLLQLQQQVYAELGTRTVPTAIVSSTDVDIVQMLALMNAVGYEISAEHQWQALTQEYRFTISTYSYTGTVTSGSTSVTSMSSIVGLTNDSTFMAVGSGIPQDTYITAASGATVTLSQAAVASATGTAITFTKVKYPMPADYWRLIDGTQWDKSRHWQMLGPETMQQKEWLKSGYISTGPRIRYYLQGNMFQIWPPGGTADVLGFDYVSNYWVTATGGSGPSKTSFTADTDTCIFPDRLMVLGTKLKYFEIKSFDTTALYRDYMKHLDICKAADAGSPTLSMAPKMSNVLLGWENLPDSGFGP